VDEVKTLCDFKTGTRFSRIHEECRRRRSVQVHNREPGFLLLIFILSLLLLPFRLSAIPVDRRAGANDLLVSDDIACIADITGVILLDVSNPSRPVSISRITTPGEAAGVALQAGILYVADGPEGLRSYDVSDPSKPVHLSHVAIEGYTESIWVSGPLAYLAAREEGFQIVDLTAGRHGGVISKLKSKDKTEDLCIRNMTVFCAQRRAGFLIADTTDRKNPSVKNIIDTPGTCLSLFADDDLLFIADEWSGIHLYTQTPDYKVSYQSSIRPGGSIWHVAARDGFAFAADSLGRMHILDYSDSSNPRRIKSIETPSRTVRVLLKGNKVFALTDTLLLIYDISSPADPRFLGSFDFLDLIK